MLECVFDTLLHGSTSNNLTAKSRSRYLEIVREGHWIWAYDNLNVNIRVHHEREGMCIKWFDRMEPTYGTECPLVHIALWDWNEVVLIVV